MAIIPKFFFDAVVAIGLQSDHQIIWIGTGFLVGRKESDAERYTIFLVTNYHIIENKNEIMVRFNQADTKNCIDFSVTLLDEHGERFSKHNIADVIAIQISPAFLKNNNAEYNWFSLDRHALTLKQMRETDVFEGSFVYSLGFPINMTGINRKTPVCRMGCISRISDVFENPQMLEYLVALQTIPGNSGAPVINRPQEIHINGTSYNSSANLIGIISGTIDYSERCENSICNMEHERNSGLAIVHPVDIIEAVVEQEYRRNEGRNSN